jgi:hypothetical protein
MPHTRTRGCCFGARQAFDGLEQEVAVRERCAQNPDSVAADLGLLQD